MTAVTGNLVNQMRELQREKERLDDKLTDVQKQRSASEKSLALARKKHQHEKEKNEMMKETLKVARHKIAQTREQMNSFENAISQRRKILSDLTLKIQEVEQQHLDGIHEYEEKLDQLAEKFSKAKNYFTKKSLEKELQKTKQAYSVHIESIQVLNSDIENLTKSVEDLELQCEALDEIEQRFLVDFPKEFQKDIINMFKDEESLAHEETLKLQKDLDAATAELDEYKEKDLEINTPAA